ncbi:MAG: segregation/condensation protein A [Patescibacteria group bacterium]
MDTDFKAKFKVRAGDFEGPLELLLELIEKRKLHINDVSLSQVADDFVAHIKEFEEFPMADSADFILIASTLLLIKSKSLLPTLELTEDEKGNIEDLERRLTLHKKFKDLSLGLSKIFGKTPLYFADENRMMYKVFAPTKEITKEGILASIRGAIQNIPKAEILAKVIVQKVISLEEMIENLTARVNESIKMSFRDFSKFGKNDKVTVIVSFLAMLELVKQGIVRVAQSNHFEDIEIETEKVSVPVYN